MRKKQRQRSINKPPADGALSLTIEQFCQRIPISRSYLNGLARKEGGDAKRAACAPLALQTVTEGNVCGFTFTGNTQLPTRARCCSFRHDR